MDRSLAESLLEPYVIYKNDESGEWRLRCPLHRDVKGDASINLDKGVWNCFAGCRDGRASDLLAKLEVRAQNGLRPGWLDEPLRSHSSGPSQSPTPTGPPDPKVLDQWHRELMGNPEKLAYLLGPNRMLTLETVKEFEIGWSAEWRFYSIPIHDHSGDLVSFKRYRPNKSPKMLNRQGSRATLYPWSALRAAKKHGRLVICEGEWDCLLLNQSDIPAVTGTNGAGTWKDAWTKAILKLGVDVVVIYDCDRSGRKGAERVCGDLSCARTVDLDPTEDDGYDVTDYLKKHSVKELQALIAGEDDPILEDDDDPILEDDDSPERPRIDVAGKELHQIVGEASAALTLGNRGNRPTVFRRGDALVRVVEVEGVTKADAYLKDSLRVRLSEVAEWVQTRMTKDGDEKVVPIRPDEHAIGFMLIKKEYPELPPLDRIVTAPILAPDGSFITEPGYHAESRTLYAPGPGMENLRRIPKDVTKQNVKRALRFLDEPFGFHHGRGFPFASEADYANTLSLLLLPFVRECIPKRTPLYLADAPESRTGKGLLIQVALMPGIGTIALTPEKGSNDEYRKEITSQLIEAPNAIVFDNLKSLLGGSALEAALTAEVWKERMLQVSRDLNARVRNIWAATSNNARITNDMAGRTVLIRLDAGMERPGERPQDHFKHPDIEDWAQRNRWRLVAAALVLCRAWVQEGMPKGSATLGGYEAWSGVMSGLLEVVGVPGFLANKGDIYGKIVDESAEVGGFYAAWFEVFGSQVVTSRQLSERIMKSSRLLEALPDQYLAYTGDLSELTAKLSYLLRDNEGKVRNGLAIVKAGGGGGHATRWQLRKVGR